MPKFNYNNKQVHYEINGEGEPLLLLNGIMMSTKSWDFLVEDLASYHKLIRIDFFDQGQTDSLEEDYDQNVQINLLHDFLKHLGINKVNLCGISYGGEVALLFSSMFPNMVNRLIIFNSVSYTTSLLSNTGKLWNQAAQARDAEEYYDLTIPVIYSKQFMKENHKWLEDRKNFLINNVFNNEVFLDRMIRLTNSAENYDITCKIDSITMPTLIVSSEKDTLTPASHQHHLYSQLPNARLVNLPNAGHASMYEEPEIFISLINGFFNLKHSKYNL